MKKMAASLAVAASVALCGGCFNCAVRMSPYTTIDQCYLATSMDAEMIAAPFTNNNDFLDDAQRHLALPLLPFSIIDFPFEVVLDTAFLPYDYWVSRHPESDAGKAKYK